MASTADIAWAAGIFEGEGSIVRTKNGPNSTIERIIVPQKDTWILHKLHSLFGGSVDGPYPSRPISMWRLNGARARGFAQTVFSFLSPRRRAQVRKALEV